MVISFPEFFESRISYLKECNREGTARNYRRAKNALERFLNGKELDFSDLDAGFVDAYQDWLMQQGMLRNSASFHLRILRAVYNKGVRKGLARQCYPFSGAYTGVDRTGKRCVGIEIIRRLKNLSLPAGSPMNLSRDMFLFSVYTRGMSFVDMVYLRKENIEGDEIVYRRRKTKGILRIKIEKEIDKIIKRYAGSDPKEPYIFPILNGSRQPEHYDRYQKALGLYNYRLKKLSEMLGLGRGLTSYVARHTWASMAYRMHIPVSVISSGMGHSSESVTRIYLDSLENRVIDEANRRLLASL